MSAVPSDEISEKYLQKAISEINDLGDEIARTAPEGAVTVLGSGHPLADVLLLKLSPSRRRSRRAWRSSAAPARRS